MFRVLGFKAKGVLSSFKNPVFEDHRMSGSKDAKELDFSKLEWSTSSFKVSDFLRKFTLPQVVKVIEGFYGDDEESSLGADQILSLHCVKSTDKLVGRDYRGKEVNIPLHCQNKVEVRPSNLKDVYESVEELWVAFPRYVRISQGYYSVSKDEEILNVGDKLHLKSIDKSKKGEEKLICVNQNGQTVELPKDCVAGFQPLADGKEYFLAEIPTHFSMPLYVQFIDPPPMEKPGQTGDSSFFNSSLGPIHIESSYTENIIIASTISQDGRRTVVTFPHGIDIRMAVCEGMLQNTVAYAEICQALNHGMDLNSLTMIDMVSAFKPRNSVREFAYKELIDPSTSANTSETNLGFEAETRAYQEVMEVESEVNDENLVQEEDNKQEVNKPDATGQQSEMAGKDVNQSPDYVNENWMLKTTKSGEKQAPPKPQRSTNNFHGNGKDEPAESKADNSSISSQSDESDTASGPKSEVTAIDEIPGKHIDISQYSVKQVSEILKELGMDRYIVKFESEKIDGEMLKCLDNVILMADFGMNKLHCMKLKKYLEGWRPKV